MTTRIDPTGPTPVLTSTPTALRTTAQPTRPFQSVMSAGASAVVGGAEAAVERLPGGSVLAAALRPTGTVLSQPGFAPSATPEGYPTAAPGTGTLAPGSSSSTTGDPAIESMLGQDANQNLYYIALQERISAENRLYTAYSNVLRTRHETMKNAIGNFR
jgi:hypothetical protein